MSDLRQQADGARKAWAQYRTWADRPVTNDSTRRSLEPLVRGLDAMALQLDAAATNQEGVARHAADSAAKAPALQDAAR